MFSPVPPTLISILRQANGQHLKSQIRRSSGTGASMMLPHWLHSSPAQKASYITGANLTVDGGTNA
jgi:hypothetical protein